MSVEPGRPVGYDPKRDRPPARPATLAELPFQRQRATRWYSPLVLADAGLQVLMSSAFGSYLDKRELQMVLEQRPFTDLSGRLEVWIDYIADTGDGFDATYTVAWLIGRAQLEVVGLGDSLPRADALILGGDQVYPDATAGGYEHRFEGPFTAALPWTPPDRRPAMFAVPGNHDWYDGLTNFMRVFGQQKSIGGWQTYQTRSYFAVKLPHRWWLWGIDVQFDAYIDEPQLRFFDGLDVASGDRIILCTAEPSWVETAADPGAYRNVAYLERKVIVRKGAELVLALAGDLHHYARYQGRSSRMQKITAGGGGAFLHPTHGLPQQAPVRTDPDDPDTETPHQLETTYPSTAHSRLLALGTLALPLRNLSFIPVPGTLHLLVTAEVLRALSARTQAAIVDTTAGSGNAEAQLVDVLREVTLGEVFKQTFSNPVPLALAVLVLLSLVAYAKPPRIPRSPAMWAKWGMGLAHAGLHFAAVAIVSWAAVGLASRTAPGWPLTATAYGLGFVLGGVVGSLVFAAYLTAANGLLNAEDNHAFSAQRLSGYKNFLRLHVRPDGCLDVHAIGVDHTCHQWRAVPEAANDDDAWVAPSGEGPAPHLIERLTLGDHIHPPLTTPPTEG